MKSKNKIILIGGIHLNHKPTCGETMKNQLFLKRFGELFESVEVVDTYQWQKHPSCLVKLLWVILFNPKAKFIISASGASRHLINFFYRSHLKRDVYFWVVGGDLPIAVRKGKYNIDALNKLVYLPVQGRSMVKELNELGVKNAIYVPNSKPITFHPSIKPHNADDPFRFIFLSRVHPEKGIKEILEASSLLEAEGYEGKFQVDFYGSKDPEYADEFDRIIANKNNLQYKGYMDLTGNDGYALMSTYDMMLFPTYWGGEGFPGVVLDANIAGLPIIATDWNLNTEVIEDGRTGIIIPIHDAQALANAMKRVIDGEVDLMQMRKDCLNHVQQYDFRNVLSENLMKQLKLM